MSSSPVGSFRLCLTIESTSSNAIPATVWFCLHIYQDAHLLAQVRKEVALAKTSSSGLKSGSEDNRNCLDVVTLCQGPLLQSMFAETLRLYQAVALMRSSNTDFTLDNRWLFRKERIIFLCSRILHLNPALWNTGTANEPHPINQFWAGRFLIQSKDDNDSDESAIRSFSSPGSLAHVNRVASRFDKKALARCWVPFGGGATKCPGRTFAKNEMLASFAMLSDCFDIELLLPPGKQIVPDMRFFSIGTLPPKGEIPFRIRRRA